MSRLQCSLPASWTTSVCKRNPKASHRRWNRSQKIVTALSRTNRLVRPVRCKQRVIDRVYSEYKRARTTSPSANLGRQRQSVGLVRLGRHYAAYPEAPRVVRAATLKSRAFSLRFKTLRKRYNRHMHQKTIVVPQAKDRVRRIIRMSTTKSEFRVVPSSRSRHRWQASACDKNSTRWTRWTKR